MLSAFRPIDIARGLQDSQPRGRPPFEARYLYADGEHDLMLRCRGVVERQILAVAAGEAEFALAESGPLLLLLARFGPVIPWVMGSYQWHLAPAESRTLPPAAHSDEERRAFLAVALVEAEDGTVRATRNVTLSLDFTRALHEAIRRQAASHRNPRDLERARAEFEHRPPSADSILAGALARSPAYA